MPSPDFTHSMLAHLRPLHRDSSSVLSRRGAWSVVGLCCHRDHGSIWFRAAVEGHVWVRSPATAGFCGDVQGPC